MAAGPEISNCGGCEFDYRKQLGGDIAAWIVVQKVSDLILNINVYMADVAAKKLIFIHSVDIRGNSDESWTRHGVFGEKLHAGGSIVITLARRGD